MRRLALLSFFALPLFASAALGQAQDGTLHVSVVFDPGIDGEYRGADCQVRVYRFIEAGSFGSSTLAIVEARTDPSGDASFVLPAGRYSVRTTCAHTGVADEYGIVCCQYVEASPQQRLIRAGAETPLFVVQDVEVRAGEESRVRRKESLTEQIDRGRIIMWSLIILGVILGGAALTGLWKLRPRYDPKSDRKKPKRYEPKEPESDPAGFDDVFGDFLKKR